MGGDEDRFTALYERYHDAVRRYVSRRAESDDVPDVVATVFLTAWRKVSDIPDAEPLPWLYGVARRVLANNVRGAQRARRLAAKIAGQPDDVATDHANAVANRVDIAAAFDRLSEDDREVLRLVAWERLEPAQAALVLGCSRATFAMRLLRARRRLRRHLEEVIEGMQPRMAQSAAPIGRVG
jgi:RNA polymerase sigma factor (sigma-70 family)